MAPIWRCRNVLHAHAPRTEELRMTFPFGRYSACYKKRWDEKLWQETLWTFSSLDSRSCECLEMRSLFMIVEPKQQKIYNDTIPRFAWFITMGATNELQLHYHWFTQLYQPVTDDVTYNVTQPNHPEKPWHRHSGPQKPEQILVLWWSYI